jgi:molecular chaperone GrpE
VNSEEQEKQTEAKGGPPAAPEEDLAALKQKAQDYLDSWKRAQADFINYKRRMEQERLETGKYANAQLMLSILPVLDDFSRALESATAEGDANKQWVAGVKLIETKLRAVLESQGLAPIEAEGKPFDPNLHEGVMQGKGKEGIVVQEMRKGYKLYDRVLRPAQVVVGSGEEKKHPGRQETQKKDNQDEA